MTNDPQTGAPRWVEWCKRIQAIAQNGLTFAQDPYDLARYQELQGILSEILACGSGLDLPIVRGVLGGESGYATPKVDVRGVVFKHDRLLLVRERSDGKWTVPGGWADPGETPAQNVVREIYEESGFRTDAQKILAVFDRSVHPHEPVFSFHVYKIFILCELLDGIPTPSSETSEVGFFREDQIPELSIGRVTAGQIRRLFEHHRNPGLPTDFDE